MLFVGLPRYQVTARLPLRKKSNLQARIELSRDTTTINDRRVSSSEVTLVSEESTCALCDNLKKTNWALEVAVKECETVIAELERKLTILGEDKLDNGALAIINVELERKLTVLGEDNVALAITNVELERKLTVLGENYGALTIANAEPERKLTAIAIGEEYKADDLHLASSIPESLNGSSLSNIIKIYRIIHPILWLLAFLALYIASKHSNRFHLMAPEFNNAAFDIVFKLADYVYNL